MGKNRRGMRRRLGGELEHEGLRAGDGSKWSTALLSFYLSCSPGVELESDGEELETPSDKLGHLMATRLETLPSQDS